MSARVRLLAAATAATLAATLASSLVAVAAGAQTVRVRVQNTIVPQGAPVPPNCTGVCDGPR